MIDCLSPLELLAPELYLVVNRQQLVMNVGCMITYLFGMSSLSVLIFATSMPLIPRAVKNTSAF
jgi:hypothetical protein